MTPNEIAQAIMEHADANKSSKPPDALQQEFAARELLSEVESLASDRPELVETLSRVIDELEGLPLPGGGS